VDTQLSQITGTFNQGSQDMSTWQSWKMGLKHWKCWHYKVK